jgi:hypothetical protein
MLQLAVEEQDAYLPRTVIVRSESAWEDLTARREPLILVPAIESFDVSPGAPRAGHHVVVPLGRADRTYPDTVAVPRPSRRGVAEALKSAGISDDRAKALAAVGRRSFQALRRSLAESPEVREPAWARPAEAQSLLPALLAGAWRDPQEGDQKVLSTLSGTPYDEFRRVLVRWSNEDDPPVRLVGDTWYLVSREDAWPLFCRYLTSTDLNRFESVVLEVLGTHDPRFDLPEDSRWMAGAIGHAPQHSQVLREHLAESLAIMGVHPGATLDTASRSTSDVARRIVQLLLDRAMSDWRIWASLSRSLSLLAEATPDVFLSAVEDGLTGKKPVLAELFQDSGHPLFGWSPHTDLLWALETLAWSEDYLARSALLLARLARVDPGGKTANRPQNSLREIFLPWHPQTMGSGERRLKVLDMLRKQEPDVTWRLCQQLLPEHYGTAFGTAKPRWREWGQDAPPTGTIAEVVKFAQEVVARMLADVAEDPLRWNDLIEALDALPAAQHEEIVRKLESLSPDRLDSKARGAIWNVLRRMVSRHRSFADADWALPADRVNRLGAILTRLEPESLTDRYAWLFGGNPELPEGLEQDLKAREAALAKARLEAVRAVITRGGVDSMVALAEHVEQPEFLGAALGQSALAQAEEGRLLRERLADDLPARARFARGYVAGRVQSGGREWGERLAGDGGSDLSAAQRAEILVCLPCDQRTWTLAERIDAEVEHCYWKAVKSFWVGDADVEHAARKLLAHNRPHRAVEILALRSETTTPLPTELLIEALERVTEPSEEKDSPSALFLHYVPELLNALAKTEGIDEARIAKLEWLFIPLLSRPGRHAPTLLHVELGRDPDFFAEIVSLAFRARGEEPRTLTPYERLRARRAYDLLESWRAVPGTDADGAIDAGALKVWVKRARELTAASGRKEIGEEILGKVLSGSPIDPDGHWPHSEVRDIVEVAASADLERGLEVGLFNSRGVVWRNVTDGGAQEAALAEKYARFAAGVADAWPRTAAMLRRIQAHYQEYARRGDHEAALDEDLDP